MVDARSSAVPLEEVERQFLRAALLDWGGPAEPTDALAIAMGFSSASNMSTETWGLWKRIEAGESLTPADWRRVLLAVEVVFASDVVGSGLDWSITSRFSDAESIALLRGLQRKLPRWRGSMQFTVDEKGRAAVANPERPEG
jgi:hypothetical protein